jgi:hypothetical protein
MADRKTNLKDAIMDLAKGIESVFRKYTKSTRERAWEKITSRDGEREIKKILVNPNRQLSPFAKLVTQRESSDEPQGLRLWLDDERPMPEGFDIHARTADKALEFLKSGVVSVVSLDHDLGEGNGTGYDVAKYIEEAAFNGEIPRMEVRVHSANPVGRMNIRRCIDNANRFWGER